MRYLTTTAILTVLTLALVDGRAADPLSDADAAYVRAKLLKFAYVEAQLTSVEGEEMKFGIKMTDKVQVVNQQGQQKYQQAQQAYANALKGKNQGAIANAAKAVSDAQSKVFDTKESSYEFDVKGTAKCNLRTLITPVKDDGTKYTQVELAGLKGTGGLPGYGTKIDSFEKDTWVRVYIDKNKYRDMKKDSDAPIPLVTLVVIPEPKSDKPAPK